jgi:hypothetical protein
VIPALIASFSILVLVLAACAGSASAPNPEDPGNGGVPVNGDSGGQDRDPDGYAALIEQRIIKTGEITLEVDSVGAMVGQVRALATRLGGYVGASQAGTVDEGATLTLRIPAARFDEALADLHELDAEVLAEATREEDVTTQIVDLEARIANLEASEVTYRELVGQATEIEDILAVQTRLDAVRGEIEQMRAQLEAVSGQADLSTLTVSIVPAAFSAQSSEWDPGAVFQGALTALLGIGQGIVNGLIWLGVVALPIALVVGIVALVLMRTGILARRRAPSIADTPAVEDDA